MDSHHYHHKNAHPRQRYMYFTLSPMLHGAAYVRVGHNTITVEHNPRGNAQSSRMLFHTIFHLLRYIASVTKIRRRRDGARAQLAQLAQLALSPRPKKTIDDLVLCTVILNSFIFLSCAFVENKVNEGTRSNTFKKCLSCFSRFFQKDRGWRNFVLEWHPIPIIM